MIHDPYNKKKKASNTASKHASGKIALSFKKSSPQYSIDKSSGDNKTIQFARRDQVKSGRYKNSELVKTKKEAAEYNKKKKKN